MVDNPPENGNKGDHLQVLVEFRSIGKIFIFISSFCIRKDSTFELDDKQMHI